MFTAIGHKVLSLHRATVGGLGLEGLPDSEWRYLSQAEVDAVFAGPTTDDVLGAGVAEAAETVRVAAVLAASKAQAQAGSGAASGSGRRIERGPAAGAAAVRKLPTGSLRPAERELGGDDGDEQRGIPPAKKMLVDEKWRQRRAALKKTVENM